MNIRVVRRLIGVAAATALTSALATAPASAASTSVTAELENTTTGLCLAATNVSAGVLGYNVALEACTGSAQEQWVITTPYAGYAFDTIAAKSTGLCLGVVDSQQPAPTLSGCGSLYDDGWTYAANGTGNFYENIERGWFLSGTSTGVAFGPNDANASWTIVTVS